MYEFGCFCYFLYCIELFDCIYYRIDWIREFSVYGRRSLACSDSMDSYRRLVTRDFAWFLPIWF